MLGSNVPSKVFFRRRGTAMAIVWAVSLPRESHVFWIIIIDLILWAEQGLLGHISTRHSRAFSVIYMWSLVWNSLPLAIRIRTIPILCTLDYKFENSCMHIMYARLYTDQHHAYMYIMSVPLKMYQWLSIQYRSRIQTEIFFSYTESDSMQEFNKWTEFKHSSFTNELYVRTAAVGLYATAQRVLPVECMHV